MKRWPAFVFESRPAFGPRNGDPYFASSPKLEGWRFR